MTNVTNRSKTFSWQTIELRNRLYAGSRIGRAVWMFVKWVEPIAGRIEVECSALPGLDDALRILDRARLGTVVRLTGGVSAHGAGSSNRSAAERPTALLDAAARAWMALAERADRTLLMDDGRWVRGPMPAEREILTEAFALSLQLHLATFRSSFDGTRVSPTVANLTTRLDELTDPLAATIAGLPPLPLSKDFACSTFPLWDSLELRWRDCHRSVTLPVRIRDREVTLTLDGVIP